MKIKFIKTNQRDINYISQKEGNLLYCTDSEKVYYDNKNEFRINISLNTLIINTEVEKESILNPLINKIYVVLENNKLYSHDGFRWSQIELTSQLNHTLSTSLDEFVSGIISKNGSLYAPKTLANSVYMSDNSRLSANLNSSKILTVTKTKAIYVEATEYDQRLFSIPYPITNYNFKENYMTIILRGDILNTENYIINNDRLIINREIPGLDKGETILFIFYYTEHIDLNELVVLDTHNYANNSITTEKISDNIRISAYNIVETIDRIFFSKEEKEKLKGIEQHATCYHHPKTHPAIMIIEDALHCFITEKERELWNNKADSDKVYTKKEVDALLKKLVGSAPEALDTLEELSKALDNNEDYAVMISKELSKKATKNELNELGNVVKNKVNIDDYVRSPMYGVPSKQNKLNSSYFNLSINDPNFKQYIDGMQVILKIDNSTNIGNSYLSINKLEPKHIVTVEGYDLIKGELISQSIYSLRYNGTTGNFILQGKGGVKLRNTSLESYFVGKNEIITRGDIIDISDKKIIQAVPKSRVLSNLETNETKYNSESNLELFKVSNTKFIVFWKFKKVFQTQVFNIIDNFVDISPLTLKKPIVISKDCIEFNVDIIEDGKYILTYADSENKVKTQIVKVDNNSNIILLDPYIQDEDQLISNINIIYTKNERAIIGWEYGNKTRCILISTLNNKINIISSRDNLEYPLDSYCFVDPTQILFVSSKDSIINGWIMNISDNDFSNSSLSEIVTSKSIKFTTPILSLVGDRKIISEWTDINKNIFYRQYITVDYKGRILYSEPYTIDNEPYRVKSNIKPKYKQITDSFYIAPSNMNYKMPSIKGGEGDKCIKITIFKIDHNKNICKEIETHCSINKKIADNLSYDFINKNTMVLAYNTKINKTDETHLYFSIIDVRKMPYGVAIDCGKENDLISIARW